ncbi:isoprenoid synthase domain-containing protein [Aspergillus varians]
MPSEAIIISEDAIKQSGAVSIFPIAIHGDYELVREDAARLKDEYKIEMNVDLETHTIATIPGLAPTHVTPLSIPYCRPERLSIMTRFCELTFLNDDYYDDTGTEQVQAYNDQLQEMFEAKPEENDRASMAPKTQQLQARFLVEMLQIDRALAMDMMATYSRILDSTSLPKHAGIKSLVEYLPFRLSNSGVEVFQDMCCFGMGLRLTQAEKEKLAPVVDLAHNATFLINDFYSWPKEVKKYFDEEQKSEKPLPVNAVCIVMQEHGCSEQEARRRVQEEIVAQQTKHLVMIREMEAREGPLPERFVRYFEAVQYTASGSEYWSCYTPRYPTKEAMGQPECCIVDGALRYKSGAVADVGGVQTKVAVEQPYVQSVAAKPTSGVTTNGRASHGSGEVPKPSVNGTQPVRENGTEQRANGNSELPKSALTNGPTNGQTHHVHEPASAFVPAPDDTVLAPYKYIASLPSKNIRDKFIDALNVWLQVPRVSLASIQKIIGMLHHSSLMLDDIEDNSTLRRGKPCAHTLYGSAQTINSANYAFVGAFAELQNLRSPLATGVFIREVQNMHCGQALDLAWKYNAHCPTVDEYMMMVDNKTGAMFRLCVQLMQAESTVPCDHIDPSHFVTQLGRYFQVRDDYQNLVSTEYTNQKGFCEDLDEGKISLPLIYTLMSPGPAATVIKGILQHRTAEGLSMHVKRYILDQMEEAGALNATQSLVREMQTDLISELHAVEEQFGEKNSIIELILRRLWEDGKKEVQKKDDDKKDDDKKEDNDKDDAKGKGKGKGTGKGKDIDC